MFISLIIVLTYYCTCQKTASILVPYLLGWKEGLVKETDKHGWTAMHYTAYFNSAEDAVSLLQVIFVAYIKENNGNRSALHI